MNNVSDGIQGNYCDNVIRNHSCKPTTPSVSIVVTMFLSDDPGLHCCNSAATDYLCSHIPTVCFNNDLGSHFCALFNNYPGRCGLPSSYEDSDREKRMVPQGVIRSRKSVKNTK
jgi:hypothetical protein